MPGEAERRPGQDGVQDDGGEHVRDRVTHPAPPPVALDRAVAELLELSDERDLWMDRLGAEYKLGYQLGYLAGYRDGSEELYARCRALPPIVVDGDSHAELERRRWGPGGRARFGDPRPGDRFPRRQEGVA